MIDTHTHLYLPEEFGAEGADAILRAQAVGVEQFVFPNVDVSTMEPMLSLHRQFPEITSIGAGLHPTEVKANWREEMAKTLGLLDEPGCVAVGEVGIDLYWDKTFREEQMDAFEAQLRIAQKRNLPVIIHCREGLTEVLEVFGRIGDVLPTVIFHSFTMGIEAVREIRRHTDAWFGINGVVTFKSAQTLRDALPEIGLDRIILETDSPYLAPVPHRGKRNESAYLPAISACIAGVLGVTPEAVDIVTTANARKVFRL